MHYKLRTGTGCLKDRSYPCFVYCHAY